MCLCVFNVAPATFSSSSHFSLQEDIEEIRVKTQTEMYHAIKDLNLYLESKNEHVPAAGARVRREPEWD